VDLSMKADQSSELVTVLDTQTAKTVFEDARNELYQLVFSPGGKRFVCGTGSGLQIIDLSTGKQLQYSFLTLHLPPQHGFGSPALPVPPVFAAVFSPDGQRLVTSEEDEYGVTSGVGGPIIRIREAATSLDLLSLHTRGERTTCVAFSPDGR